ncbi:DNA-binding protein [Natronoarchaeum rubrum]|uniref:DNA-binding protein n=1 Tax=Natronoarchaeum rubrum TaxID=755311 RepID=UPI0021136223|nr:DNA-binding protein [Natronoarchaeum rubrum]
MSTNYSTVDEVSVAEQTDEYQTTVDEWADEAADEWASGAADEWVVDETPELRASVEQDVQATVDYADDQEIDGRLFGQTLAAQERLEAREWEVERTHERWDRGRYSMREEETRVVVSEGRERFRREFQRRAASVDPRCDPDASDPRARLSREELAMVNKQARRVEAKLDGWSRAAISRRLAERVVDGCGLLGAVVGVFEELEQAAGTVIPISAVEEVDRGEVSIEGRVKVLWEPSHSAIAQVGLLEDDSGVCKFTVWKASEQAWMSEGERVRIRDAAKSWYEGRVSLALTRQSEVYFPDRQ